MRRSDLASFTYSVCRQVLYHELPRISDPAGPSANFRVLACRYTIPVNYVGYSIFILVFEVVGSSNTVLQGLYLLRRKEYHYGSFLHSNRNMPCGCCQAIVRSSLILFINSHVMSAVPCSTCGMPAS